MKRKSHENVKLSAFSSKPKKKPQQVQEKNVLQMFYSLQLVVSDQIQKKDKSACQFSLKCRMICCQFFKKIKVRKNIIPFKI